MSSNLKLKNEPKQDPKTSQSSEPVSVEFTEDMHGFFATSEDGLSSFGKDEASAYQQAAKFGKQNDKVLKFRLTISVEDVERFVTDPKLVADATGYVDCPALGGRMAVEEGIFNLFLRPVDSPNFDAAKEMHYRLLFIDNKGETWTFQGFKVLTREDPEKVWSQTTTLYTRVWRGKYMELDPSEKPWAQGILTLNASDFAKQMTTLKSNGPTIGSRIKAISTFMDVFAENLWEAYAPALFDTVTTRWNEHIFPLQSTEGVKKAEHTVIPFHTEDGISLSLSRFKRKACQDVVLLIHGLTTSTDMFIMPEHENLVSYLLDHGYTDVISLDWRGSNRFSYNLKPHSYTMDYLAIYDMPKAIETVRKTVGEDARIPVIAHCVGSIGFMTSLSAGFTKGVTSVISNSVSLTPQIPWQAMLKIKFAPWLVENVLRYPYISPEAPYLKGTSVVKLIALMEGAIRNQCKEPACHMISFMWGWGFPAAYEHKNIHPLTHRRLKDLFGGTSMNYFRHMNKMVSKKEAIPNTLRLDGHDLPASYLAASELNELPPILFMSGDNNKIFPGSNKKTFEILRKRSHHPELEFAGFQGYGHQDVFMGKKAAEDIFPTLLTFLDKHKGKK